MRLWLFLFGGQVVRAGPAARLLYSVGLREPRPERSSLRPAKKDPARALSRQTPVRPTKSRMSWAAARAAKAPSVYWLPRPEWKTTGPSGCRWWHAALRASAATGVPRRPEGSQPTTRRAATAMTVARWSQPPPAGMQIDVAAPAHVQDLRTGPENASQQVGAGLHVRIGHGGALPSPAAAAGQADGTHQPGDPAPATEMALTPGGRIHARGPVEAAGLFANLPDADTPLRITDQTFTGSHTRLTL